MLADLIGEKSDRKIDKSQRILITKYTLRLDDDVYQMSNITGFGVGKIPKPKFSWGLFLILGFAGLAVILQLAPMIFYSTYQINEVLMKIWIFCWSIIAICNYFMAPIRYGLSIQLNSGREVFVVTSNKSFLSEIVLKLYELMDGLRDCSMAIDMRNYSIYVSGNFQGNLAQGDSTTQGDSANIGGPFNGNFAQGGSMIQEDSSVSVGGPFNGNFVAGNSNHLN
jgi:hypothetical protein